MNYKLATLFQENLESLLPQDIVCGENHYSGNLPHPIFCPFFYFCIDGESTLMECPSGLYYNPRTYTCDYPENVSECQDGTRPPTSTQTTSTSTTTQRTTTTRTPSTSTTRETTDTTDETPVTEPTYTTTTEGPTTSTDSPSTSTTRPTTTTTSTPPTTVTPPPGDFSCPEGQTIFMPYPKDCTRYYACLEGIFSGIRSCSQGLWFSFDLQACRSPWDDTCPTFSKNY
jgi:hypothetical protein